MKNARTITAPFPRDVSNGVPCGQVYMINLERRPDRRERMLNAFDILGVEAKHIKAVDGKYVQTGYTLLLVVGVSQGRICSDSCVCCHTEIEVADPTFYLTQYTDTRPTSPCTDPVTPGAWQGSHWNASFEVTDMTQQGKISSNPGSSTLQVDALATRSPMWSTGNRGDYPLSGNGIWLWTHCPTEGV